MGGEGEREREMGGGEGRNAYVNLKIQVVSTQISKIRVSTFLYPSHIKIFCILQSEDVIEFLLGRGMAEGDSES